MKKFYTILVLLALTAGMQAQTPVPAGNVSGTWTLAGSPYLVEGDIAVPDGNLLTIEPGVRVEFQGRYELAVQGRILAAGTVADSIVFTAADPDSGFNAVAFLLTPLTNDSSLFEYCSFSYGNRKTATWPYNASGAIGSVSFSKVRIDHCSFKYNRAMEEAIGLGDPGAGAVAVYDASILIQNSTFESNESYWGGAICIMHYANPVIRNCVFGNNHATWSGGAISIHDGSCPLIQQNTFVANLAESYGGAINLNPVENLISSDPVIEYNLFYHNTAASDGGAIEIISPAAPVIRNNTIMHNIAYHYGGGIDIYGGAPVISNTILYGNSAYDGNQVYIWMNGISEFRYCDIEGGDSAFGGEPFTGIYFENIEEDPLVCDTASLDFHLWWDSPCIDRGDTACVASNSTRCDIGAFEGNYCTFQGNSFSEGNTIAISVYPQPVTGQCRIGFDMPQPGNVHVEVLDMQGRIVLEVSGGYKLTGVQEMALDLSALNPGLYLCRLSGAVTAGAVRIIKQ